MSALLRSLLRQRVRDAVQALIDAGIVPEGDYDAEIADPKQPEHGDFTTNFALLHARRLSIDPRELAQKLASVLAAQDESSPLFEAVEIAGPGFVNFRLKAAAIAAMVPRILEMGENLLRFRAAGRASELANLNVEFVSVNPNGPITVGSGRGAAFGSTLCNVLEAAGHKVHREYYINDGTNSEQMRLFALSVKALACGLPVPQGGYKGDYVQEIAEQAVAEGLAGERQSIEAFRAFAQSRMIERQREDLAAFSTTFNTWFSEQSLHDSGFVNECIDGLIAKGAADEEPFQLEVIRKKGELDEVVRHEQPSEEEEGTDEEPALHSETYDPQTMSESSHLTQPAEPSRTSPDLSERPGRTLWLRSTKFADDKDRVLRRRDGRWTYIASDVAYHKSKFERGSPQVVKDASPGRQSHTPAMTCEPADKLLTILGPDHHGYIGRLRAVVAALLEESRGTDGAKGAAPSRQPNASFESGPLTPPESLIYRSPEERDACLAALEEAKKRLEVIIFQIVRFVKDGKPAPMRKRDGNIYSLRDLMLEIGRAAAPKAPEPEQLRVGKDVARFFYLMRSHDTHMDFDLDLAEKQSDENPVFYVQYAHARICSVIRKAKESGLSLRPGGGRGLQEAGFQRLEHPKELALIKKVCDLPHEVERCAQDYGVHRLTVYAQDLARAYHLFYDSCRVIQPEDPELSAARLALCEAARVALAATLRLLGVSAPERMVRDDTPIAGD